jgi:transitional endoplasmic reticulum ATPase
LLVIARGWNGTIEEEPEDQSSKAAKSSAESQSMLVENETVDRTGYAEKPKGTTKRVLPDVETPAHLEDNLLLKAVRAQLKVLLDEIDNTKEEDWPSEKTPRSGGDPYGYRGLYCPPFSENFH